MEALIKKIYPKIPIYEEKYADGITNRARVRSFETFYDPDAPVDPEAHPDPIPLAGGCPDEGFFPIESIHMNLIDEPFQHLSYEERGPGTNDFDVNVKEQIHKLNEENVAHTYRYPLSKDQISIHQGFQYGGTDGFGPLKSFSKKIITTLHKPAYDDYEIILTNGSGDSLFKISDLIGDEGGSVLVEEFTFSQFNVTAHNYGCTAVPVKLNILEGDEPGIDVKHLDELMTNWETGPYKHLSRPKALYTIPTGQNPTGLTQSLELRKKVYALCEKHDLLIIEDDPYGYLVLPKYGTPNIYASPDFQIEQYAKSLTPSYMTIDTSGRVIRLDTYSKLFSPGLRLGFITANPYIIGRIYMLTLNTTRSPSGVAQVILNNVIERWGGLDGWLKWSAKVAKHYTIRRDVFLETIYQSESYKKGQLTVVEPDAGMFIIVYLNFKDKVKNPSDFDKVMAKAKSKYLKHGVEVIFGTKMATDLNFEGSASKANFLRLTIAAAHTNDILKTGTERLCAATEEFFEDLNAGKYEDILTPA